MTEEELQELSTKTGIEVEQLIEREPKQLRRMLLISRLTFEIDLFSEAHPEFGLVDFMEVVEELTAFAKVIWPSGTQAQADVSPWSAPK
jgi:hypothetical protein